jgi:single-stranded-DNA-specific exonuclease
MQKYKIRENIDQKVAEKLSGLSDFTKHLLYHRNIKDIEEANRFLNPDYDTHLNDPLLFKDIEKAMDRIFKAIEQNENIGIFSDYDADGIPGAVVLKEFFEKIGHKNTIVYIPHRNDEGYGLNDEAIKNLKENGVTLIITIDCGISDHKKVELANSLGLDVIITDHHLPHSTLPEAFAILNPKQKDCNYPEKMLCGSGVVFKLIQAVILDERFKPIKEKNNLKDGFEKWFLDMVGLATLSDMVPLLGENRVLAHFGLKVLKKTPRSGLLKLFSLLKIDKNNLNEDDIGFLITPRINVASRMGHPKDAFCMLSSDDLVLGQEMAIALNKLNDQRKGLVSSMIKEIKKTIEEREDVLRNVIVLGNPNWKPSLLGLVANSFSEEHNRPVFVWGRESETGLLKGSCRSGGNISIVSLMEGCKDLFADYGGHSGAGGFSIDQDKIHLLENRLNEVFENSNKENMEESFVWVDKVLHIDQVSNQLYKEIEKFAPFGFENPKPVFLFEDLEIFDFKNFGKEKNHLELSFKKTNGQLVKAIAFFKTNESFLNINKGVKIKLLANIEKSNFRNIEEIRLRILDVLV